MPRRATRKATSDAAAAPSSRIKIMRKRWVPRWEHPYGQPLANIVAGSFVEGRVTIVTKLHAFVDFGAVCDGVLSLGPQEHEIKPGYLVKGLEVISVDEHPGKVELAFSHVKLKVTLVSGEQLAELNAVSSWTGADAKTSLRQSLPRGHVVRTLVYEMQIFEDSTTVAELGIVSGSVLQAMIDACDYLVEEAGVPEVNGCYKSTGECVNGAPSYINEAGILLFRFVFGNGVPYWYFSRQSGDLTKKSGDFYRVKTEIMHPPEGSAGWDIHNIRTGTVECPLGDHIFPVVSRISGAGSDCEENCEELRA